MRSVLCIVVCFVVDCHPRPHPPASPAAPRGVAPPAPPPPGLGTNPTLQFLSGRKCWGNLHAPPPRPVLSPQQKGFPPCGKARSQSLSKGIQARPFLTQYPIRIKWTAAPGQIRVPSAHPLPHRRHPAGTCASPSRPPVNRPTHVAAAPARDPDASAPPRGPALEQPKRSPGPVSSSARHAPGAPLPPLLGAPRP